MAAILLAAAIRTGALVSRNMISKDGVYNVGQIAAFEQTGSYRGWTMPAYPLSVWALRRVTGLELQTAGHVVAIFFGALIVVPLYAVALRMAGPTVAKVAVLLHAAHPTMIPFDTDILSVSMAAFFALSALWALWEALSGGKLRDILAAPLLILMAIASRREAVALVPVFALAPMVVLLSSLSYRRRSNFEPAFKFLLCAPVAVVAAVVAGWPILGHQLMAFLEYSAGVAARVGVAVGSAERQAQATLLIEWIRDGAKAISYLYLPFIVAAFWAKVQRRSLSLLLSGAAVCGFLLLLLAALGRAAVSERYFMTFMPVVTVFTALGLVKASSWLPHRTGVVLSHVTGLRVAFVVIFVASAVIGMRTPDRQQGAFRRAAEYIVKNFGPGQVIASTRNQVAYYAAGIHVQLPGRASEFDSRGVRFAVLRPSSLQPPEYEDRYLERLTTIARLRELAQFGDGVILYELGRQ